MFQNKKVLKLGQKILHHTIYNGIICLLSYGYPFKMHMDSFVISRLFMVGKKYMDNPHLFSILYKVKAYGEPK
jgi:hypothetical protein